jgi:hypothetical protein
LVTAAKSAKYETAHRRIPAKRIETNRRDWASAQPAIQYTRCTRKKVVGSCSRGISRPRWRIVPPGCGLLEVGHVATSELAVGRQVLVQTSTDNTSEPRRFRNAHSSHQPWPRPPHPHLLQSPITTTPPRRTVHLGLDGPETSVPFKSHMVDPARANSPPSSATHASFRDRSTSRPSSSAVGMEAADAIVTTART